MSSATAAVSFMAIDLDIRFMAEKWLRELGPDAPRIIRTWCEQTGGPTTAGLLQRVADAAEQIAGEQSASPR